MLDIVRGLLTELGSHEAARKVSLNSSLEGDLGLGSLERVELLVRAERRFGRRLPDDLAHAADTPAAWVRALLEGEQPAEAPARFRIQPQPEAPAPAVTAASFSEVLRLHADRAPERVHVHLLDGEAGQDISHAQLLERSSEVAAGLTAAGLRRNEAVAIMLPTCEDFFYSFLGVMLAGGVAVPIYPPARPDKIEEYVRRQTLILRNAEVRFLISFEQVKAVSRVMRLSLPSLSGVTTAAALRQQGSGKRLPSAPSADTFFIQYTSGSTGNPKGVVLSHANVLANVQGIGWAVQARPDDVVVSWLPLYHDMGLIGAWLFSLFYGFPITIMSPLAFLSRPERWLWALSDSRGTLCPAPNFSYELCARKIPDEAIEGVDLRAWRVAINAGEPVLPDTLTRFAQRFEPYGFRPESYVPCYGLAESSVALTFPPINRRPVIDTIRRDIFETEGRAVPAAGGDGNVLRFVANGKPLPGHEIRVVDDSNREAAERVQGRLLFRGPSKTSGYYRNPEATAAVTVDGDWMDSGDLGYLADGEVYVTGRKKDCIIKAGHNIIPQEVEMAAAEVPGVRRGCVAAFGTMDRDTGTERLVVVAETRATDREELQRIRAEIIRQVDEKVGTPPDRVELAPPHTVPKTSSGKIRRNESRQLYEAGNLRSIQRPAWLQMVRLSAESLGGWPRLAGSRASRGIRRAYGWAVMSPVGFGGGLAVRLWPGRKGMAAAVRHAGRMLLRLCRGGVRAQGFEKLDSGPVLLMANRSGRMDSLVLLAATPRPLLLADERMISSLPRPLAFLLEPLVAPPAEVEESPAGGDLELRIRRSLEGGHSVLVLAENSPETPAAQSRFRLEALQAAAAARCPVHPVRLDGVRGILENGNGLEPAAYPSVSCGSAIRPRNGGLRELARCRDEAREVIGKLGP